MFHLATASRRSVSAVALAFLLGAPAYAATYQIGLFEGASATGTGSGQFTFTVSTPGAFPVTPTALSTNNNSLLANTTTQCKNPPRPNCLYDFTTNSHINVVVSAVNFSDGKTPPNQITGNYVEGLTGTADTAHENANRFVTCNATGSGQKECFYRITFTFTPGAPTSNPNSWVRTFTIDRYKTVSGVDTFDATVVSNGRYFVRNTVNSAPEPGSLALVAIALATLVWGRSAFERITRKLGA